MYACSVFLDVVHTCIDISLINWIFDAIVVEGARGDAAVGGKRHDCWWGSVKSRRSCYQRR